MTNTWLRTGDKARLLLAGVAAHRELSTGPAHEDAKAAA
jgi:hypothetical protein